MKILQHFAILVIMALMVACSGGSSNKTSNTVEDEPENTKNETTETAVSQDIPEKYALGKKIYDEKCAVCHQADGKGMVGAFPPLKDSDYLMADPKRGIHQTLNGSNEEMIVNGETYNMEMVPQVDTKEEALAVINYVLKYYNNSDIELTMDDIKDIEIEPREE